MCIRDRAEIRDENLQAKLDAMVESGAITQEQADEWGEWYGTMPADVPGLGGRGFGYGPGEPGFGLTDKESRGSGFEPGERGVGPGGRGHGHGRGGPGGFGYNAPDQAEDGAAESAEGTSF